MTVGQTWKLKRDLAIYDLHRTGHWSYRQLGAVFDLAHVHARRIVLEVEAMGAARAAGNGTGESDGPVVLSRRLHCASRVNRSHLKE